MTIIDYLTDAFLTKTSVFPSKCCDVGSKRAPHRISCRKLTAIYLGFDFGQMLATASQNLEQLELELRTTLLGKMAGQVHQLLSIFLPLK